jgi:hypothetical protein
MKGNRSLSRLVVVRYPSRRAFELIADPAYPKVMPYCASLKLALIPTDGTLVVPELRFVLASVHLSLFLLTGWIRATRRKGRKS